jgi:hypothetical protein
MLFVCKNYTFCEVLQMHITFKPVLGIRTRIRRIRMFLGLPDPDPLVRGTDPDPLVRGTDPDPDPHQNVKDPQHWFKLCLFCQAGQACFCSVKLLRPGHLPPRQR